LIRACLWYLAGVSVLQLSSSIGVSDRILLTLFAVSVMLVLRRAPAALALFAGLVFFQATADRIIVSRLDPLYAGDSMLTELSIADFPTKRGQSIAFMAGPVGDPRIPPRIRLSWYEAPSIPAPGEVWQLEVRLKPPRGNLNPGAFDYEGWLFRERVGATGYVVNGKRNVRLAATTGLVEGIRRAAVARIERLLGETPEAAVVAAVAVGARHAIPAEQWQRYARTGTGHLMAISGLHVGLAGGFAFVLLRCLFGLLRLRVNARDLALSGACACAAAYAALSGFAVPAQRATLMLALVSGVLLVRRRVCPFTLLASAALFIGVADPVSTLAPGFRFSFAAVLVLVVAAGAQPVLAGRTGPAGMIAKVHTLWRLQLALLFGLAPIAVLTFARLALHAPVVNLAAVPVFSLVTVPCALAGLVLSGPAAPLGDLLLRVAGASVSGIERLIDLAVALPASDTTIAAIEGAACVLLVLLPVHVLLPKGWPGRGVAWLALAAVIAWRPAAPPPGCVEATFLDVGQGSAAVIRTNRHAVVYDTGPSFTGGANLADRVLLPFLAHSGIDRVDTLVVSHADIDHAGGVAALASGTDVARIIAGEPETSDQIPVRSCRAGDAWIHDAIRYSFLHPDGGGWQGNDASCVLAIDIGRDRWLLTGDIERRAERALLDAGAALDAMLVTVPHHGSPTSSSAGFVASTGPAVAIVSAGYRNRWGLPAAAVVDRWESTGAAVLDTATSGAIRASYCGGDAGIEIETQRVVARRYWHAAGS